MSSFHSDFLEKSRQALAQSLKAYRQQKNLSQKELAATCGLTQATVSEIETGKSNPTFDVICKLAEALEVPPFALFGAGRALGALGALMAARAIADVVGKLLSGYSEPMVGRWLVNELVGIAQKSPHVRQDPNSEREDKDQQSRDSRRHIIVLGRSGVGKSAVINSLVGEELLSVGREERRATDALQTVMKGHLSITEVSLVNSSTARDELLKECESADCILFVTAGEPYREDLRTLDRVLASGNRRIIGFVNKWDVQQAAHTNSELSVVISRIRETLGKYVQDRNDIVFGSSLLKDQNADRKKIHPVTPLMHRIEKYLA